MTFDYAQATLGALAEESGRTVDKIYMIGDNPHTDIKGANEAKAGGAPWESVLVKTGIFQDAAGTGNHPQHPASLVWCVFLRPAGTSLLKVALPYLSPADWSVLGCVRSNDVLEAVQEILSVSIDRDASLYEVAQECAPLPSPAPSCHTVPRYSPGRDWMQGVAMSYPNFVF